MSALDFYSRIKLINYIRSLTAAGKTYTAGDRAFEDDKYMQPTLEEDPLLFSVDEEEVDEIPESADERVKELEAKLRDLTMQFQEYKSAVSDNFAKQLEEKSASVESKAKEEKKDEEPRDDDTHYFNSYAGNDIHEIMLKDAVRTDAYRDFIYGNKDLFKDKVVLDVGCGTGILSMFCAKAGAKKVIAVDNSAVINKARANIFENKLDHIITCVHGKIEEITLPVKQVDIIVSEWMGYCLLYEAMLNSVLYARDKYLAPNGLMVPSECKILLAAVHDPEYMNDYVNYWDNVYGFQMTAMKDKIRDDVIITHLPGETMVSEPKAFIHLPLHTVKVEDLVFTKPFEIQINKDIDSLDGFVVYFDNYFATSRDQVIAEDARAETWKDNNGGVSFTTAPGAIRTHWQQGYMLVEVGKNKALKAGEVIKGEITYRERAENSRELEIEISWKGDSEAEKQLWTMR
jgi:protein arginine N-methyltransferase 3